jgi:serine protease Do
VYAFGAPRKMAFSMSRGMVSYTGRDFEGLSYMQIDLALNGGSSGGPIVNSYGEVVGISSFILKKSQGLSFALPIDYARERFARYLGSVPLAAR